MAYNITLPNGVTLNTIADGTVDNTTTSLTLLGRNYSNYGQYMVNNLVDMLVNFSYGSAPSHPQVGQLWYNSTSQVLSVCTANSPSAVWQVVGTATSEPNVGYTTTVAGSFWWDSANQQLYVYNGTSPYSSAGWVLVGPQSNHSGAISEQLFDLSGNPYYVLSLYLGGVRTAVISSSAFTSNVSITGIGTQINVGYNVSSAYTIYGTANNSSYLGALPAASYWNGTANNVGTGSLTLLSNVGVKLGTVSNFVANVMDSSGSARLQNTLPGGNVSVWVTTGSGLVKSLAANGADGLLYVIADPTQPLGVATKQYVDNNINANAVTLNASITEANVGMAGYVNNQVNTANIGMAGYVNNQVNTANIGILGYINQGNTIQATAINQANIGMFGYVNSLFNNSVLTGVPTAPTAAAGTTTTQLATTEFVINNSGFKANAIYQLNSSLSITDTGVGSMTLAIDGSTVATATSTGFNLFGGATAVTQSDTYNGVGGTAVATTGFVKNATQWWGNSTSRSAKWVSTSAPNPGVNDIGSNDGDIWFQISS